MLAKSNLEPPGLNLRYPRIPAFFRRLYPESKSSRTLLVVTTGDLEEVTLEFVAEGLAGDLMISLISLMFFPEEPNRKLQACPGCPRSGEKAAVHREPPPFFCERRLEVGCLQDPRRRRVANLGSHALLHEGTELALIIDLDDLLRPIGRVGDVELHLDGAARSRRRARVCRQVEVFRISSGIRLVEFLVV